MSAVFLAFTTTFTTHGFGQETPEVTTPSKSAAQADLQPKTDQASVAENPEVDEIKKLIQEKDLAAASEKLDTAIAASDNKRSEALTALRIPLARELVKARRTQDAFEQYEKLIQTYLASYDEPEDQAVLVSTIGRARLYGNRIKASARVNQMLNDIVEKVARVTPDQSKLFRPLMASLMTTYTRQALDHGDTKQARELIDRFAKIFDEFSIAEEDQDEFLINKMKLLTNRIRLPNKTETDAQDFKQFISTALESNPDSIALLTAYTRSNMALISEMLYVTPQKAIDEVAKLRELIGDRVSANSMLRSTPGSFRSFETIAKSVLKQLALVGKPAPEFEIDAWINAGSTTEKSLQGKVILLDFWAVWCGPCIASFPHMRHWREEFKDADFEILGVTRYQNYRWDEEAKRAIRVEDKLAHEDEQKMLRSFWDHHQMKHPTIVVPEDSKMHDNFQVQSIPQVVIIDQQGVVQLVTVGAKEDTIQRIDAKLKELLK